MPDARVLRRLLAGVAVTAGVAGVSSSAQAQTPARPAATPPGAAAPADPAASDDDVHGLSSDLLTGNGLRSPWCAHPVSAVATRNCKTGGLTSSGASGDNSNFDVHIDTSSWTGAPRISEWFLSMMLSLLGFAWTAMVMLTRGVFVALEFAFGFNPLDTSHAGTIGHDLNRQLQMVTRPLAVLLAPAGAVWLLWTAAANRRHGHALKQFALSALLITAATVVLSNPIGTVGSLLTASQKVGLAVISLTSGGSPSDGTARAQNGLRQMADSVIDQPLALLEFGSVAFGSDPAKTVPELRAAAAKMAASENPEKREAVAAARSNLDLFQVWPANSKQRNSINDEDSLLRVLCGSDEDTDCKGPNGQYAEWRTERGAWQRAIGMLLIAGGLLPFWIALLFCAVKVIGAGILTVIRLIQLSFLAPLAVVGETGNQRVIALGGDLVGGVLAAAAYSFFLGLVMTMWKIVTHWSGYGFVMQWLLLILTLWLLIMHRDRLSGAAGRPGAAAMGMGGFLMRQAAFRTGLNVTRVGARTTSRAAKLGARGAAATGRHAARTVGRPLRRAATANGRPGAHGAPNTATAAAAGATAGGASSTATPGVDGQGQQGVAGAAGAAVGGAAAAARRPGPREVQGARRFLAGQNARVAAVTQAVRSERVAARPALAGRRDQLAHQLSGVAGVLPGASGRERKELLKRQARLSYRHDQARRQVAVADRATAALRGAQASPGRDRAIRASQLDRQAALPRGATGRGPRRNYEQLSAVLGVSPQGYRAASSPERLKMRADVDRELGRRVQHRQVLKADQAHRRAEGAPTAGAGSGAAEPARPARSARPEPRRPRRSPAGRREAFRETARRRD